MMLLVAACKTACTSGCNTIHTIQNVESNAIYRVSHKKVYLVTAFSYDSNTVTKTVLLYINECSIENEVYFYQSIYSRKHLTRTILFRAVNFLTARNRIIYEIFEKLLFKGGKLFTER